MTAERTPQELAQACADAMWAEDAASRGLGMKIVTVGPGTAVVTMTVREDMVNGHGICHGGYLFTLADSAFAFACNTYDQVTVAAAADITFIKAAELGDVLTAAGAEQVRYGRSGIYDIVVTDQEGEMVATFRGRSRTIGGSIIDPED
jgi:acyl-CoA thioesterase